MWILHIERWEKGGKIKIYEWNLTDSEFNTLIEFAKNNFKPLTKYREFIRKIYEREKSKLPPKLPVISFMGWNTACVRNYLGIQPYIKGAGVEWRPEVTHYRLQYTVMYYAREVKKKTPNPFCECRAWCIVPETSDIQRLKKRLKIEAWYIGVLFPSLYWAWEDEEIEKVTSHEEHDKGILKDIKMRMIREGWEMREVEEGERGITRAVAFYKDYASEWDEPAHKYDESKIRHIEDKIKDCILKTYDSFYEYKVSMAELIEKAAEIMSLDYDEALNYIRTAYGITSECMPEHPTVRFGFILGGEE